ncbi:WD40 repeat domain-containing protein [Nostoc sp. FACHB-973]|nr:WD40 repeat domain-containing protein [Nostoc sp. FACHB-973]
MKQTIATTADDFYGKLTQQEKDLVRNIFVRLTRLDENAVKIENSRDTRKRVEFETLIFDDSDTDITRNLVERLAGAGKRLVITSVNEVTQKPEVEVAHEALIRYWSKLRGWLIEDRGGLLLRQRTEKEAEEWESTGKKEDLLLLQGSRLQEAVGLLLGKGRVRLNKLEKGRDYVVACQKLQERKRSELEKQRDEALENQITTLTALAEARFQDDQLGALVHILKAGRILQQLRDSKSPWMQQDDHFQAEVILVQILGKIQESNRLEGHQGDIRSIDFSTNGEIATVDGTGTVMFWQQNGEKLETSLPPNLGYSSVVFRPNSREIAAAIEDTIYLWDLDNEEPIKSLSKNTGYIQAIAFSSDGKMLATASMEGDYDNYKETNTLHLWNLDDGSLNTSDDKAQVWKGVHVQLATAFSFDGKMIASTGWGQPELWKIDGSWHKTLEQDGGSSTIAFSNDGQMIATQAGNIVKLWNIDGAFLRDMKSHIDNIWSVSFSPNSEMLASASNDTTVKLWDKNGSLLKTLHGHRATVRAVRFSSNGDILASASDDGTVKLWKLGGTPIKILPDHTDIVYTVRFSPNGTILTTSGHGFVNEWKLDGTLLETKKIHNGPISTLEFSSNGMMVTTSGDRGVKLWNSDGSLLTDLRDERGAVAHQGESLSASFSPNNQIIATGGVSRIIKLWSTDGSFMKNLGEHEDIILGVSFSPDSKTIASASLDGTVKLWSIDSSKVETLPGTKVKFVGITFSPDDELNNQIIAAAAVDGTVRRWKRDGTELPPLERHEDVVRAVCFSPNGQLIATASYDKTVKLWNKDGTWKKTLYGHTDHVNAVAFSKDGKTLASASNDKTAILWNVEQEMGLDRLIDYGCDWISGYLTNNPNVSEGDKKVLSEENFPLLKYEAKKTIKREILIFSLVLNFRCDQE